VEFFGPSHLAVLAVTAVLCALAVALPRRRPDAPGVRRAARALAVILIANEVVLHVLLGLDDRLSLRTGLPLHLTDAATVAAAVALWSGAPLAFELLWFWAMTATVQALITPDLNQDFPDYRWWAFWVSHSGTVVAAVGLAWGVRLTPRPGAVRRVYLVSLLVAVAAGVGSALTGGNYMFLREAPEGGSLLDLLGPWPWYLGGAAVLALALFWLLDRPFDGRRRRLAEGRTG
jgi:hypothetical integral membrane protein (TIGR02206 family)